MLAVASSHFSKWQKIHDHDSRQYLKKAFCSLQSRLKDPSLVYEEGTIVAMLSLLSYEVGIQFPFFFLGKIQAADPLQIFNGASGWVPHYNGIMGWLSARGNCSDLNPFIKTWVGMVDTQKALNLGGSTTPEVQKWLESSISWTGNCNAIDPFFGCSARLPRLMVYHKQSKLMDLLSID